MGQGEFLFLLQGFKWTLALAAVAFVGGTVSGLAVALARTSGLELLERATAGYIAVFQGTPLLMQLFVVYYALALAGLRLEAWQAVAIGFTLHASAYLANDGMTMICVTHEMGFARQVADRVIFTSDGSIVEEAPPAELFKNPKHERTKKFLGEILSH